MSDLIGWRREEDPSWRPKALKKEEWPPDYSGVYAWRAKTLQKLQKDPEALKSAKFYYRTRPVEFIMDWMDTYDPRTDNKWMPFVFFEQQARFIEFLHSLDRDQESGLVEKSRDMGASWGAVGYSIWCFLFKFDDATGWGSRKETLVDKPGDPDSLFEKMRLILKRLPKIWLPKDFKWSKHSTFMKLINPETRSIISGEAGDAIGRGGRKTRFFVDEAAHIERPEKIEASLGDNTNVRIDISSVNGLGNIFHRRRENGIVWTPTADIPPRYIRVFVMDWRDHPLKTQEWYDRRKAQFEREGLAHIFAQEVDRNYSAAVSNVVIPYEWIQATIDAHIQIPYFAQAYEALEKPDWVAGLDVADEGTDRNALMLREWVIWRKIEEWGERDPGVSARRAIIACRPYSGRIQCQYDSIGVGSGVKTEYNRITQDEQIINPRDIPFIPWNAGSGVLRPTDRIIPNDDQTLMNKDMFENLKAQAWWSMRTRCFKTFKARTEGAVYPCDELISLDSSMGSGILEQLKKELGQPTFGQSSKLKMLIEKKPNGTKSPNLADAGVISYHPLPLNQFEAQTGYYG